MHRIYLFFLVCLIALTSEAQILTSERKVYTRADSLRGSLRPERTSYDVKAYDINVRVNPNKKYISGVNQMAFKILKPIQQIQIDLFASMNLDSVIYKNQQLQFKREFNAVFIQFKKEMMPSDQLDSIQFHFSGYPTVAKNAPWDGGFVFEKDQNNQHFIGVAVQGTGASLWLPNKDHLSDEPEKLNITIECPKDLMGVSNGRLVESKLVDNNYKAYTWQVNNPINSYNITINIGDYVHFSDRFKNLDLEYYVLRDHLEQAKSQFKQVKPMMACFYEKFGEYPFVEDSYKLIESPYLGMEHQSAVAYGNEYNNGYLGRDLSGTGIGLKWDFIIIHESGHEWFGNSISAKDIADLWIHESFTSYSEAVYVECEYGKEAAENYLFGLRQSVANNKPIIGDYGVNAEGSGDMYYKGANLLNTIRNYVNNDTLWWQTIKRFHEVFKHQTITTKEVITFFNVETGLNLSPIFNQYLRYAELPTLIIKQKNQQVYVKWKANETDFKLPVEAIINGERVRLLANTKEFVSLSKSSINGFKLDTYKFYFNTQVVD